MVELGVLMGELGVMRKVCSLEAVRMALMTPQMTRVVSWSKLNPDVRFDSGSTFIYKLYFICHFVNDCHQINKFFQMDLHLSYN